MISRGDQMTNQSILHKCYSHLRTVMTHRKWVRHYCYKLGLRRQGWMHDLSKYSPTEFLESARFYQGTRSPIDACKESQGYSMAWLHHRGRNRHHWEYWVDGFSKGMRPILMPYPYAAEMLCDFLGAGRAYLGHGFTIQKECEWWNERRKHVVMHRAIRFFLDWCFAGMNEFGEEWLTPYHVAHAYRYSVEAFQDG